jgi:hypothetical protein
LAGLSRLFEKLEHFFRPVGVSVLVAEFRLGLGPVLSLVLHFLNLFVIFIHKNICKKFLHKSHIGVLLRPLFRITEGFLRHVLIARHPLRGRASTWKLRIGRTSIEASGMPPGEGFSAPMPVDVILEPAAGVDALRFPLHAEASGAFSVTSGQDVRFDDFDCLVHIFWY